MAGILEEIREFHNLAIDVIAVKFQQDYQKIITQKVKKYQDENIPINEGFYQDFTNVWLFRKLAEMEIRLKTLESK